MSIERLVVLLLGLVAAACGDDLPDPPEQVGVSSSGTTTSIGTSTSDGSSSTSTSAMPASSDEGGTTTTGPSSVGIPDECTVSADCADGEPFCVAPFDQSAGPEGKGAYECVSECVMLMDEDRWCADATVCCDPLAECTDRGYCVEPEGSSSGSESGGSTDTGSTGGSTG